jgi:hypothetical protein
MLAGGDSLYVRRSTIHVVLIAAIVSMIAGEVWWMWYSNGEIPFRPGMMVLRGLFIFANGLLLARFLARWMGNRAAAASGFAFCTMFSVILGIAATFEVFCLVAVMHSFARQAIPGRLPVDRSERAQWVCWILFACLVIGFSRSLGLVVLVVWLLFGVSNEHGRLLIRLFFLNGLKSRGQKSQNSSESPSDEPVRASWVRYFPFGLAIIAGAFGLAMLLDVPVVPMDNSYLRSFVHDLHLSVYDFMVLLLPWWPMLFGTLYLGLHRGYYALPLFQYVALWLLVTTLAMVMGLLTTRSGMMSLTPSLAVAIAPALMPLFHWVAARRGREKAS